MAEAESVLADPTLDDDGKGLLVVRAQAFTGWWCLSQGTDLDLDAGVVP
jgi:hypothetical protein